MISDPTLVIPSPSCVETFSADPDHSHSDSIVGLDVTHKLRVFASCSLDCTVRIWSEDNLPLR